MEKRRYELEIADVEMAIISDEREDFVNRLATELDNGIRGLMKANKRCSKLDAAILCALDYACDKNKAEKRVRNLEAQVALYDANIRRLREELARLKGEVFVCPPPKAEIAVSDEISDLEALDGVEDGEPEIEIEEVMEEDDDAAVQLGIPVEDVTETEAPAAEETASEEPDAEEAPTDDDKQEKLRRVEELLRRRGESGETADSPREDKLRQIESLLRNK